MKRISWFTMVMLLMATTSAMAQRYDFDDIYFNPKHDLQKVSDLIDEVDEVDDEEEDTGVMIITDGQSMSYTDRIKVFHRTDDNSTDDRLAHIGSPDYTTNVFVLSDGRYVIDVDGDDVEISSGYGYPQMDWSGIYWTYPGYYGPSYYSWYHSPYYWYTGWGWNWNWGWSWYGGYYDPWYSWGWHSPYYHGPYCHHHCYAHHYYDYHHSHYGHGGHHGGGSHWWDNSYARRASSENSRRAANVSATRPSSGAAVSRIERRNTGNNPSRIQSSRRDRTESGRVIANSRNAMQTTTPRAVRESRNAATAVQMDNSRQRRTSTTNTLPARPGVSDTRRTVTDSRVNSSTATRQSTENRQPQTTVTRRPQSSVNSQRQTPSNYRSSANRQTQSRQQTTSSPRTSSSDRNTSTERSSSSSRSSSSYRSSSSRSSSSSMRSYGGGSSGRGSFGGGGATTRRR